MPQRFPWDADSQSVIANAGLGTVKENPEYVAAKSGDDQAAWELVLRILRKSFLQEIEKRVQGADNPCLLPVLAMEERGANKIPAMAAAAIAARIGCPVETRVYQANKAFRTGSRADHRLTVQPEYAGEVDAGREYLLIDDTFTMGATLANLRGHCIGQGARVCGILALSAHPEGLRIAPNPEWVYTIRNAIPDIDTFWMENFGYEIDCITHGEAGHLRKARSVDEIRSRFASARDAYFDRLGSTRIPERAGRPVVSDGPGSGDAARVNRDEGGKFSPFHRWAEHLVQSNPHSRMFSYAASFLSRFDSDTPCCMQDIQQVGAILLHPSFRQATLESCSSVSCLSALLEEMDDSLQAQPAQIRTIFRDIRQQVEQTLRGDLSSTPSEEFLFLSE